MRGICKSRFWTILYSVLDCLQKYAWIVFREQSLSIVEAGSWIFGQWCFRKSTSTLATSQKNTLFLSNATILCMALDNTLLKLFYVPTLCLSFFYQVDSMWRKQILFYAYSFSVLSPQSKAKVGVTRLLHVCKTNVTFVNTNLRSTAHVNLNCATKPTKQLVGFSFREKSSLWW